MLAYSSSGLISAQYSVLKHYRITKLARHVYDQAKQPIATSDYLVYLFFEGEFSI